LLLAAAVVVILTGEARHARGYIDIPPQSLARLCEDTKAIAVLRVEKVNREKRGIVYSKVRDLKGNFPTQGKYFGDTFAHVIRRDNPLYSPSDKDSQDLQIEAILGWAAEGKTAVVFQRGGEQSICVGHSWYTARPGIGLGSDLRAFAPERPPPEKELWVYGGVCDSRFARFFCGDAEELVKVVTDLLAGRPATSPRMVGTARMLSDRSGLIDRFRADREEIPARSLWVGTDTGNGVIARPPKEFSNPFRDQAPWSTHRGGPQRTGSDGGPDTGANAPRVLWAYKSENCFVAPPVPGTGALYAAGLGAFHTSALHALALDPAGDKQLRWLKGAPLLRLPVAGAPAVVRGHTEMLVFGDGIHTDEGASLRCLRAADGFPLWQLSVPGKLVHFEGTPTFAAGKLYVGGGNAGVLCVEPGRVTLAGKEQDLSAAQSALEGKWKELHDKYEVEKKKDPQFALPPDEDMLPRPVPKLLWQRGQDQWHIDAPVALVEDHLLAASAFLDDEKTGERALNCLRARDGEVFWKVPLKLNPWAGPTVGPYVLVGCSSIRLDPKAIPGATGEVVAVEVDTGKVRWRKDVPGGVLSAVAVKDGLAVFTATDGKVRAWDAFTGAERWAFDAGAPFFAGPAVAGRTVYAADLGGVVHALSLADGRKLWTLQPGPERPSGPVYGSPVVHGGRLYLAVGGPGGAPHGNGIICVGEK
jgi:outer membrane protein assembly factor BamB